MYIYNVTVNIEDSIHDEWLKWMKEKHIPHVMDTGLFLGNRMLQVMVQEESGTTYTIQYDVKDIDTLKLYQQVHGPRLQKETKERYGDKVVAFRTVLRLEHEHES